MKKQLKRQAAAIFLSAVMAAASPFTALADSWQGQTGNWRYLETTAEGEKPVCNSWKNIQGLWYHFDENGQMQTGWYQNEQGTWFYLNQYGEGIEGAMRTGWYQDRTSGKWYYLNPQAGADEGAMMTGWINDNGKWYYLGRDGAWVPGTDSDDDDGDSDSGTSSQGGSGSNTQSPGNNGGETSGGDSQQPPDNSEGGDGDKEVIKARSNVITFDPASDEGMEELKQVYEEMYDYWTDDMGTEDTGDDEYNILVGNDNPLYQHVLDGTFRKDSVIYIPACEYFPVGASLIYLYHDDEYEGQRDFEPDHYEVIHTRKATLGDIIEGEVSFSLNEVNEENPLAFFWVPEYSADSGSGLSRSRSMVSRASAEEAGSVSGENAPRTDYVEEMANYGAPESVNGAGWQLQNIASSIIPTVDFDDINDGKIGLSMNSLVLYDKDGNKDTKYDRLTIDGSITLSQIKPLVDLEWKPTLSDPLPKQFISKLSYTETNTAKITLGGGIKSFNGEGAGFGNFENSIKVFGMDIEGVDMSGSLVIAAAGINVGTRVPQLNIKSIQYESVFVPLTPTFLVLFMLDASGEIKATVVGEYESVTYVEKGVNCQKDGFVGRNGTCEENKGQKNYRIANRNINIYNLAAKSKTEKNKAPVSKIAVGINGEASAEAGIGAGVGIMMAGIMPFMIKGTLIGLEVSVKGNAKGTAASDTGVSAEGELTGRGALISKLTADLKLTAKTFLGNPGISGSWELGRFTWLEAVWSTVGLSGTVMASDSDRYETNNPKLENALVEITLQDSAAGTARHKTALTDAEGAFQIGSLENAKYNIKVSKDGYITYEDEVDIKADMEPLKVYLDTEGERSAIYGSVHEADEDTDASNNPTLSDVAVTAVKIGSSSTQKKTVKTGTDGNYSLTELPKGLYELTFEKDGYITVRDEIEVFSSQETYNAVMEIISESYAGQGIAEGTVINALNGESVGSGISLRITKDVNISDSDAVMNTQTDGNGKYSVELPAGVYTVWLTDNRTPKAYEDDHFTIKVLGGCTIDNQNGEMTPILDSEEIRIVLTWGAVPRDLDSHLSGPLANGGRFHTYYSQKDARENGSLVANLDVDDVTSYGPETTTIYHQGDGIYRYAVHDYTNRSSGSSSYLAKSGAFVRVYRGSGTPVMSFSVPNRPGTVWNVFDYDSSTGKIIPLNTMEYKSNPSAVAYLSSSVYEAGHDLMLLSDDGEEETLYENDLTNGLGNDAILPLDEIPLKDYELAMMATASDAVLANIVVATASNAAEALPYAGTESASDTSAGNVMNETADIPKRFNDIRCD